MLFKNAADSARSAGLLAILLAVAGCATVQVGSDYDRSASFSNFHTFTLMHRQHHAQGGMSNPLVIQRTEDAIKAEMARKGYQLSDDGASADFTVDFTIGSQERTDVNSYPDPYIGPGWGFGRRGCRGAITAIISGYPDRSAGCPSDQ